MLQPFLLLWDQGVSEGLFHSSETGLQCYITSSYKFYKLYKFRSQVIFTILHPRCKLEKCPISVLPITQGESALTFAPQRRNAQIQYNAVR